jgi:membrane-associated protease RseP (regulator of RpoE activity)
VFRSLALVVFALYACGVALFVVGFRMRGVLDYDASGRVNVEPGSPAQRSGMVTGDRLVSIGDAPITDFEDVRPALRGAPDGDLSVRVERGGVFHAITVGRDTPRGRIGVHMPVVRREVDLRALLVRSAMEPASSWRRAWLNGDLEIEVAPDADGPVVFAEFLRPKESGDAVVSAAVVTSYALLVPVVAAIAAGLGAISAGRHRPRRT